MIVQMIDPKGRLRMVWYSTNTHLYWEWSSQDYFDAIKKGDYSNHGNYASPTSRSI